MFVLSWRKRRAKITRKFQKVKEQIEKIQDRCFLPVEPYCLCLYLPPCMSANLCETLEKILPSFSEKELSRLSESEHKMYDKLDYFKTFAFKITNMFFNHFHMRRGFNRESLVFLSHVFKSTLSLGEAIRINLWVEANGMTDFCGTISSDARDLFLFFASCCITIVKIGEEMLVFVSTWDTSDMEQKSFKNYQTIYKVMGMGFDQRAVDHPEIWMSYYPPGSYAEIECSRLDGGIERRKVLVGQHIEGDDSLIKNLKNRFDGYETLLEQKRARYEESEMLKKKALGKTSGKTSDQGRSCAVI